MKEAGFFNECACRTTRTGIILLFIQDAGSKGSARLSGIISSRLLAGMKNLFIGVFSVLLCKIPRAVLAVSVAR